MVKVRVGGSKLRQKAERRAKAQKQAQAEADDVQPAANVPRRLQQKITKRVRFLEKVAASRAAPRLEAKGGTKKRQRRPAISERLKNFSSLAQSLEEAAKEDEGRAAAGPFHSRMGLGLHGTKKRVRIVEQETKRLQQVLAHPQYRADPIGAITTHLSSQLPAAPELPKQQADPQTVKQQKARRKWEQRLNKQDGSVVMAE